MLGGGQGAGRSAEVRFDVGFNGSNWVLIFPSYHFLFKANHSFLTSIPLSFLHFRECIVYRREERSIDLELGQRPLHYYSRLG